MSGHALVRAKEVRDDGSIVDIVIWQLDEPVPPCAHTFKYRMYYGAFGVCRVRYDNERGKGDHKHLGFIHVHHLKQLADIGAEYQLNPLTDLRPVFPNCHAMLHRRRPAYSIEELVKLRNAANKSINRTR